MPPRTGADWVKRTDRRLQILERHSHPTGGSGSGGTSNTTITSAGLTTTSRGQLLVQVQPTEPTCKPKGLLWYDTSATA